MSDPETTTTATTSAPAPDAKGFLEALDAKTRTRLRNEARAIVAKEVREEKAAKAKQKPAPELKVAETPAQLEPRTDAQRKSDAAVFLQGLWLLAGALVWPFGFQLRELTEATAQDDAGSWVPLARRYRWFDLLITWAGAPLRLLYRVKANIERRPEKPATTPKGEQKP